jgi:hypothetical protein
MTDCVLALKAEAVRLRNAGDQAGALNALRQMKRLQVDGASAGVAPPADADAAAAAAATASQAAAQKAVERAAADKAAAARASVEAQVKVLKIEAGALFKAGDKPGALAKLREAKTLETGKAAASPTTTAAASAFASAAATAGPSSAAASSSSTARADAAARAKPNTELTENQIEVTIVGVKIGEAAGLAEGASSICLDLRTTCI